MREKKREFRRMLRAKPESKDEKADALILERLQSLPSYRRAKCVFAYVSVGYEVDTYQLIEAALTDGKRVCLPRCMEHGVMDAVCITSLSELKSGAYNIPEPPEGAPIAEPSDLDLILVPGMAFDRSRNRLGRGAGYYDRYLERADRAVTVGICHSSRLFENIPHEMHDRKVDVLITEEDVLGSDNG